MLDNAMPLGLQESTTQVRRRDFHTETCLCVI